MAKTLAELNVKIGADTKAMERSLRKVENRFRRMGRNITDIGDSITRNISLPIIGLGVASVHTAAKIERYEKGLAAVMGSMEMAGVEVQKLKKAAENPGLNFEQAIQGSLRLQNVGLTADQSREALLNFGNAIALAGGTSTDLDGVTLALTQIASKGKISAEEINQLAERVPQVRTAIKSIYGTSDSESLQKMGIDVNDFINNLTAAIGKLPAVEGGLTNAFENIKMAGQDLLLEFGKAITESFDLEKMIKNLTERIKSAAKWWDGLSDSTQNLVLKTAAFVAGGGVAISMIGRLMTGAATFTKTLRLLSPVIVMTKNAQHGLNLALRANPIGLIITAVAALGAALVLAYQRSEKFRGVIKGIATVAKEVFNIIKETLGKYAAAFQSFMDGDIKEGFKQLGDAVISSVPITAAAKHGERLGSAFVTGYQSEVNKLTQHRKGRRSGGAGQSMVPTNEVVTPVADISTSEKLSGLALLESQLTDLQTKLQNAEGMDAMASALQDIISKEAEIQRLKDTMEELRNGMTRGSFEVVNALAPFSLALEELPMKFEIFSDGTLKAFDKVVEGVKEKAKEIAESIGAAMEAMKLSSQEATAMTIGGIAQLTGALVQFAGKSRVLALVDIAVNTASAIARAVASAADKGFPYNLVAMTSSIAAVMSGIAQARAALSEAPALAMGGLAFGPTMALVGDNPNAGSDPEVIAPLSKLRNFLNPVGSGVEVTGTLRANGRELLTVIHNAQAERNRFY